MNGFRKTGEQMMNGCRRTREQMMNNKKWR